MTKLSTNHKLTAIQKITDQEDIVLKWLPISKQIVDIITKLQRALYHIAITTSRLKTIQLSNAY